MECVFNKTTRYTLYYDDIVGSGEFFQSRLKCRSARALFSSQFYVHINLEWYVVISEQKILPSTSMVMYIHHQTCNSTLYTIFA